MEKRTKTDLGLVGEKTVIYKLLRDFNIVSVKVPQQFFAYDLITNNGKKLEVKTARPSWHKRRYTSVDGRKKINKWLVWEFRRSEKQLEEGSSNIIVCIGFESEDMSKDPHVFIIPSKELINEKTGKPRQVWTISIEPKRKSKFSKYENQWDYITQD